MDSFRFVNPTELVFGPEAHLQLAKALRERRDFHKPLVLFGGGSARKSGVLDAVLGSMREIGCEPVEKGGVRPNPTIEFVREAIELARAQQVDAVIAVGGGSVIDTAKTVAAGVGYAGDCWDFFCGKASPETVLPLGVVLTIPAAGSEQSKRAVVSNGIIKTGMGNDRIRPLVSAINPALFFTLSKFQAACGIFDMMSHIFERYFTRTEGVDFTTESAEAALRVILRNAVRVMSNPKDFDAWSAIGLAGSFAHNGFYGLGHVEDWACHGMEHALSGIDPTIAHGAGLAVLTPAWMRFVESEDPARFERFALHVMEVSPQADRKATIDLGIAKLSSFIQQIGLPNSIRALSEQPIDAAEAARLAVPKETLGNFRKLTRRDVETIIASVL